jgi:hypothetical protein
MYERNFYEYSSQWGKMSQWFMTQLLSLQLVLCNLVYLLDYINFGEFIIYLFKHLALFTYVVIYSFLQYFLIVFGFYFK